VTTIPLHAAPDALLLIGHGSRDMEAIAEYNQFAASLSAQLRLPVQPCFLEFADPPIVEGVRACVALGAQRIIALPLFLGPAGHQKNDVPALLNWAKTEWPQLEFKYGTPLGAQAQIIGVLTQRAAEAIAASPKIIPAAETALLLVGRGSRDPDSNSDLYKMARMLWEGREYGWVETAFYDLTRPNIETMIERCVRLGARRIVSLPYLLFTGRIRQRLDARVRATQTFYPGVDLLTAEHLGNHPGVIEAVYYRYQQALEGSAAMTCDLCKYRHPLAGFESEHGLPQGSDHAHGFRGIPHHSHSYEQIDELLPPRYRNGGNVNAAPMSPAALQYDAEGQVAWDKVWASFCDLALAGGPPHRGDLLEPVLPETIRANPAGYRQVLAELERGIHLVTGLLVAPSQLPGWVGMVCHDEAMARWILRASVAENICVRREGAVIYFPAGPDFRLDYEIKNIITVAAKTHHYWTEHIAATGQQTTYAGS
jgi:sirohydrochlorin cobaltochelatase